MSIVRRVYMHMFEILWCKKLGGFVTINTTLVTEQCLVQTQQTLWREKTYHYVALMSMGARHTLNLARCSLQGTNICHQTDPNGKMKIIDSNVPLGWDKLIPRVSNTTINAADVAYQLGTWHLWIWPSFETFRSMLTAQPTDIYRY